MSKIIEADDPFSLDEIVVCILPVGCIMVNHTHYHSPHVLQLQKLSCWWIPHILTDDHMTRRMDVSLQFLMLYHEQGENVLDQVITWYKTWMYYYTPPSKQANKHPRMKITSI